jgi:hypothetical protein
MQKPLIDYTREELRAFYETVKGDELIRDLVIVVGLVKRYDPMTIEELREEYKQEKNQFKRGIIKQYGEHERG